MAIPVIVQGGVLAGTHGLAFLLGRMSSAFPLSAASLPQSAAVSQGVSAAAVESAVMSSDLLGAMAAGMTESLAVETGLSSAMLAEAAVETVSFTAVATAEMAGVSMASSALLSAGTLVGGVVLGVGSFYLAGKIYKHTAPLREDFLEKVSNSQGMEGVRQVFTQIFPQYQCAMDGVSHSDSSEFKFGADSTTVSIEIRAMRKECLLMFGEISQLLEAVRVLEKELPKGTDEKILTSITQWKSMTSAFLKELEKVRESEDELEECLRNSKIISARLHPIGVNLVEELQNLVEKVPVDQEKMLQFVRRKQQVLRDLEELSDESRLSFALVQELTTVLGFVARCGEDEALSGCMAEKVEPLYEKCKNFLDGNTGEFDDFDLFYKDYLILCEMAGLSAEQVKRDSIGLKFLKEQIGILAPKLAPILEQESIRHGMNEVMKEKGFPRVGFREKILEDGQSFVEDLFLYRPGVAVSVLYRWDGKILLVVGGISDENREATLEEGLLLKEYMEDFQENMPDIQEKMLRKGVILADQPLEVMSWEDAVLLNQSDFECEETLENLKLHSAKKRRDVKKGSKANGRTEGI